MGIKQGTKLDIIAKLIKSIIAIEPTDRSYVIWKVRQLLPHNADIAGIHTLITTIHTLPPDQRDSVIAMAEQFVSRESMLFSHRLINAIIDIPPDPRDYVVSAVRQLVGPTLRRGDEVYRFVLHLTRVCR